jgi:hypothetical protein
VVNRCTVVNPTSPTGADEPLRGAIAQIAGFATTAAITLPE